MRVIVVTNQFPSRTFNYKGSFVFQQVKELKKHIDDIYVIAPNYGRECNYEELDGIPVYRFRSFTKKVKDPLLRNLFEGFSGKISLFLFILSQILKTYIVTRKEKIEFIHAHWVLPSGFSSLIVSVLLKKRLIVTSHGSDLTFCKENKVLKWFLKIVLKGSVKFIGDAKYLTDIAQSISPHSSKYETVPLGISNYFKKYRAEKVNERNDGSRKSIITVGSLYPLKGVDYLIESLYILSKRRNDFICNIVGDGVLFNKFKQLLKKYKLEKNVILKGFLPHEETIGLIANSDIAVQTSLSEGLSVFVQESIYLGKPVIATDVGGTKEIVIHGYNGYIIEPENIQDIVRKLDLLLDNYDEIKRMGINSINIAEETLDLQKNVEKIVDVYYEVR